VLQAVDRRSGREFEAVIASAQQDSVLVKLLRQREGNTTRSRVVSLTFALAKGGHTDEVCEKSCELGVQHLVLWQSARSVVRISSAADREKKLQRWRKIAESAAKQSGNDTLPKIHLALSLPELLQTLQAIRKPEERSLLCSLATDAKLPAHIEAPRAGVHLAVGPEGDFEPQEENSLRAAGFEAMSLGPLTLRCETAALVAISMVHGAWGFLSGDSA
jgi:16S rRNA (uracil1498-N3)-methyltransferase